MKIPFFALTLQRADEPLNFRATNRTLPSLRVNVHSVQPEIVFLDDSVNSTVCVSLLRAYAMVFERDAVAELIGQPPGWWQSLEGIDAIAGGFRGRVHGASHCFVEYFLHFCASLKHNDAKLCVKLDCYSFGVIERVAVYWALLANTRSNAVRLTAIFQKVPEGYIGFVEEVPGANTQGETLDETRENLAEALELVLEANRVLAEEAIKDQEVIREPLVVAAG